MHSVLLKDICRIHNAQFTSVPSRSSYACRSEPFPHLLSTRLLTSFTSAPFSVGPAVRLLLYLGLIDSHWLKSIDAEVLFDLFFGATFEMFAFQARGTLGGKVSSEVVKWCVNESAVLFANLAGDKTQVRKSHLKVLFLFKGRKLEMHHCNYSDPSGFRLERTWVLKNSKTALVIPKSAQGK